MKKVDHCLPEAEGGNVCKARGTGEHSGVMEMLYVTTVVGVNTKS